MSKVTPKDFFLWVGALVALYGSIASLITLLFQYINYVFPDALQYYSDPYGGAIRFSMASLIVLTPLFLVLMRLIRKDIAKDSGKKDIWVRRFALYMTLFVAGAIIAIDLITLINTFLGGEVTNRFLLKVAVVLLVAGGGFLHFLADVKGYWITYPRRAQIVGVGAGLVALLAVVSGFFIIGTPGEARLVRFDDQRQGDLQSLQWQVVNYWQQTKGLPMSASELQDDITGFHVPVDPETGEAYVYEKTGDLTFRLCATFNRESRDGMPSAYSTAPTKLGGMDESWNHSAGTVCFDRTINPQLLKPYGTD